MIKMYRIQAYLYRRSGMKAIRVNRSELRQEQSSVLRKAVGQRIVVIGATPDDDEKYIVDRKYFDRLLDEWHSARETLEIATDVRLLNNLLSAADTIDEDLRRGRLKAFEDAF